MSFWANLYDSLYPVLVSPGSYFSVFSLGSAFVVAMVCLALQQWRRRGRVRPRALLRAFFSNDILRHRSSRADMLYMALNIYVTGIFIGWACFGALEISRHTETALNQIFGVRAAVEAPEWALRVFVTIVLFLAYEFGYWFDHYLKHRVPALWETHKTHHTAERLSPLTVWRVHPLDSLVFTNVMAGAVGLASGGLAFALGARFSMYALGGTNLLLVAFFFVFVHLQHSQVWLPLTGALGKIFMSPSHHQIHHSIDPAHYNSNMGNALAIYDWLFGTLVIPSKESPRLAYGVLEPGGDHHSITQLIVSPIANVITTLVPQAQPTHAPSTNEAAEATR